VSLIAKHHHPSKGHEGDAVGDEMIETAMEKRGEQNTAQADCRARYDAEAKERAAED